jgi:hypothetical protein
MVAERAVELLEAVEVDEEERQLLPAGCCRRDRLGKAVVQQVPTVAQTGQVVGDRLSCSPSATADPSSALRCTRTGSRRSSRRSLPARRTW